MAAVSEMISVEIRSVAHFHMSQDNRLAQKGWRLFKIEKSYFEYREIKIRDEILL